MTSREQRNMRIRAAPLPVLHRLLFSSIFFLHRYQHVAKYHTTRISPCTTSSDFKTTFHHHFKSPRSVWWVSMRPQRLSDRKRGINLTLMDNDGHICVSFSCLIHYDWKQFQNAVARILCEVEDEYVAAFASADQLVWESLQCSGRGRNDTPVSCVCLP